MQDSHARDAIPAVPEAGYEADASTFRRSDAVQLGCTSIKRRSVRQHTRSQMAGQMLPAATPRSALA